MQQVYVLDKDKDKVNLLGEQGWGLTIDEPRLFAQGFPILISKEFGVDRNSKIIDDVAIRWLEALANQSTDNIIKLKKYGFVFRRVYSDEKARKIYRVDKRGKALLRWRIEFNHNDDTPMAYITFGNAMLQTPALANKEIIDKYVPKDILDRALECGSIKVKEIEESAGLDKGE